MTKPKILFFSDGPIKKAGGAQISMKIIMEGLTNEYDFFIVSPGKKSKIRNHIVIDNIDTFVLKKNGIIKIIKIFLQLRKKIKEINPDLIHIQTSSVVILINLLKKFRLISQNIPIVYTDREVYKNYGYITRYSINNIIEKSEHVITTTNNNLENYKKYYKKYEKFFYKFNTIPNTAGKIFEKPIEKKDDKRLSIGFCGRFIPNKNWPLAERILKKIKNLDIDYSVIIIIGTDSNFLEEIEEFSSRANKFLQDKVEIYKDIESKKIAELFDEIDILIMTSKVESFGRTAVEAMARNTVVLGTNEDGIPEVIGDSKYICENEDEFIEKILCLYKSEREMDINKQYFYSRYKKIYSTTKNLNAHIGIYNDVISRKNNPKLLFLGPLPPPIGGDTVSFSRIIMSSYFNEYSKYLVDTSRKGEIRITGRRIDIIDITNGLNILLKTIKNLKNHEVLIFYSNRRFLYTIGLLIILVEKLFKKKVIVRVFGSGLHKELDNLPKKYFKIAIYILKKIDFFLVQTNQLKDYLIDKYKFNKNQVIHYPNFVPDKIIRKNRVKQTINNKMRCVYIGQIKKEKGIFDILDAINLSNNFTCDFYGPIYNRDKKQFLTTINKLERASYEGIVKHQDVCEVISNYDLLLLPSYHEGEGYAAVVFEAFAVGVPVIVTKWNAFPEFINQWNNGVMIPIKSPESISITIERLIKNKDDYLMLKKGALETSKMFSEKRMVGQKLIPIVKKNKKL